MKSNTEQLGTPKTGIGITVKLDDGNMAAIAREGDATTINPGDRVRILSRGGVSRVVR